MSYSQVTMQSAFRANESRTTLHRHMITVADAEFSNNTEYEDNAKRMVMDTLRQGDNYTEEQ